MLQASANHCVGRPHANARTDKYIGIDYNTHGLDGIKNDTKMQSRVSGSGVGDRPSMLPRVVARVPGEFDHQVGVAQFDAAGQARLGVQAPGVVHLVVFVVVGWR